MLILFPLISLPESSPKDDGVIPKDDDISTILSGVTFTLSGFKDPYRSELRDMATDLRKHYKPDWVHKLTAR